MNIVVLAGGTSTERDVSIMTSMMVCGSLRRNGHHANMIDVFTGSGKYKHSSEFFQEDNDLKKLADSMKEQSAGIAKLVEERERIGGGFFGPGVLELCQAADIVYIGLHGANGEDGKIQAAFDLMGIKYTGTGYLSSAISMSKELTKKVLVSEGVPMPKGISLKKGHKIEYVPYPCVVKPCCGGSSVGVSIANNEEEFRAAVEEALREAQMGGFLQAGTEHLLLALCGQQDSGAVRLMNKLAVDIPNLTIALRETIRLEQCEQNNDRQIPKVVGKAQRQIRSVMLDRFGRELTELARQGRLDPVIGREQETERLLQILSRRSKNNPCLIGEAGVGKTAVVEGVEKLTGAPIQAYDLRAGAAMVIAALAAQGESEISNVQYIERGYEDIIGKLRALGADIRAIDEPDESSMPTAQIC